MMRLIYYYFCLRYIRACVCAFASVFFPFDPLHCLVIHAVSSSSFIYVCAAFSQICSRPINLITHKCYKWHSHSRIPKHEKKKEKQRKEKCGNEPKQSTELFLSLAPPQFTLSMYYKIRQASQTKPAHSHLSICSILCIR